MRIGQLHPGDIFTTGIPRGDVCRYFLSFKGIKTPSNFLRILMSYVARSSFSTTSVNIL